jgi:polysaccharide biosynthesis protein VpsQ
MKWAAAILFALFVLLVIILADMGQLGVFGFIDRIPYSDKVGHFLLYGILALLIDLSLFCPLPSPSRKLIVVK